MSRFVIFKKGSKQYRVQEGDIVDIDLLNAEKGTSVEFEEILFVGGDKEPLIGTPSVKDFQVKGEVLGEVAGPKITSIKYKPSHNEIKKFGHRERYTRVKITSIAKHSKQGK